MLNLTTDVRPPKLSLKFCEFGLTEIAIPAIVGLLSSAGVGAATAGTIASVAAPALISGGVGALTAAATGGKPLKGFGLGALGGGLLGGAGALFPETMGALGMGPAMAGMDAAGNIIPGAGGMPSSFGGAMGGGGGALSSPFGDALALGSNDMSGAGAGTGGGGGALGNIFGGNTGLGGTLKNLGALGNLFSSFAGAQKPDYGSMPGPETTARTQGPLFNAPLSQGYLNRTMSQPAVKDWYTYGNRSAMPYFQNNQVNFPGMRRGGRFAGGGAMGQMFDSGAGQRYVGGAPGDGQSDSQPALLSAGEYVIDASTVSRLGSGDNKAGARKLDQFREQIAKHAGAKKVIPPKAKAPSAYLQGAR